MLHILTYVMNQIFACSDFFLYIVTTNKNLNIKKLLIYDY